MEHGLEWIIARLEIFGNLISYIFPYPGNIGNRVFLIAWYPGNTGGGRAAPGVVLCCLGLFLEHVSWNFRISWKYWKYDFSWFLWFLQKRRAPKFHAEWSGFRGEISHMRPIQARKLKLFQTWISKWRRRRRTNNSPIWQTWSYLRMITIAKIRFFIENRCFNT